MKKLLSKMNPTTLIPARYLPARLRNGSVTIPVVRLKGVIAASNGPFDRNMSLASVAPLLEDAFKDKKAPAVALSINSPGGSPVQSRLIFRRIRDLAEEHNKQVLVFTEDAAASGGYMIAVAGDEIIADPSSIIGSIGVISSSFGFVEAIKKLGIERRVYTAGQNKSTLDPFKPENAKDIEHIKSLQLDIHKVFIDMVKERRGDKLADNDDLFSGQFWAGEKAKELGLVDGIGDMRSFLKARFGPKTKMRLIAAQRGLFGRKQTSGISLMAMKDAFSSIDASALSAQALDGALTAVEERALWNRLGL